MGLPTIAVPRYTLKLPSSGQELKFRPFLVKEEKILLLAMESEDQKQILEATKIIIENCLYTDINVEQMPAFDIEYVFLQLRGKAKGEVVDIKYTCPKCEGEIPVAINLDDIKVIKHKEHTNDIKLVDNLGIIMKYPTLPVQEKLAELTKDKSAIEGLFETMVHCVDCIYDSENTYPSKDHTPKEIYDFLESLTDKQFQKIAQFFDTIPALKHNIELKCQNKAKGKGKDKKDCGYKESVTLEGLGSFFA